MRKKLAHLLRTVADKLTKEETCDLGIGKCIKKPTTTAKAKEQLTNSILLAIQERPELIRWVVREIDDRRVITARLRIISPKILTSKRRKDDKAKNQAGINK